MHVRVVGTQTLAADATDYTIVSAPPCPAGYHVAGGSVGALGPVGLAIGANLPTKDANGIETQRFWINSPVTHLIVAGSTFTVYAECVKGEEPTAPSP